MQNYQKKILNNGLRLIAIPQIGSLTATVLVLVEAGSKYETKEKNGISHFLEHLCFKGTKKRPTTLDISTELDNVGAEYNAFTSQEWTGYFAKAQAPQLDTILDAISDLYINPIFPEQEIEKERGVIIEELNMYEDIPQRKVQDVFTVLLYGDQPAGWNVGGRKEVICKLTRDDFLDYRRKHYLAEGTVVVVAGAFDHKSIVKKIEKYFGDMPLGKKIGKKAVKEFQQKPQSLIKYKDSDQTHLILGCRAFDVFDERRHALNILADILGGGMSSRLFQKIRAQLGAAYYINSDVELLSDHGFFSVSAGIDHKKLIPVIEAILDEFKKISCDSLSEKEIKRSKNHLSGRLLLELETSDALALFYGGQEILREKIFTPEELLKQINRVTKKQILEVAKYIFQNQKLNLAFIGPHKDCQSLEKILKL